MAKELFSTDVSRVPSVPSTEFVLDELYRVNFGTWALPYAVKPSNAPKEEVVYSGTAVAAPAKPWGDFAPGPKGQVYRMPMAIRPADGGAWYQLPNEPMVDVEGDVQVVKTTINRGKGKRGTVTEEEHLGDYAVRVRGIIYNEVANAYPEEEVKLLNYHFIRPGYLEVKHYLLNQIYNIHFLKIERLRANREARHTERWQPYVLECFSVDDFDLS